MAGSSLPRLARLALLSFLVAGPASAQNLTLSCDEAVGQLPEFSDLARIYSGILARPALHCTHATLNSCEGEKLDTHWHFRAVDADLMQKEMDAWRAAGRSGGREPIGIVDGLFGPHLNELLQKPAAEQNSRTSYGHDLSGHGSETSQLIGGAEGLGLAPQNPLYAYDVADNNETVDPQSTEKALHEACDAGVKVLNLSVNTNKYVEGTAAALSDLVTELAKKGCVLVKAAGNDSVQDPKALAQYEADFPLYLSVGATRRSGGVAAFSDLGSVYAPGQDIAVTLPPSQVLKCGMPKTEAVDNGTSFSAPIVTAITAQVREVLQTSAKFRALYPVDQVRTIVRMVKDSADAPTANVNALKAVRGAMAWVATNDGPAAPPAPKDCGKIPPACLPSPAAGDCNAEAACSQAFRTALALCPDKLGKDPFAAFLGASALDPWLGMRIVDTLSRQPKSGPVLPAVKKLIAKTYDEAYWRERLAQVKKPPAADLDNFLDLYGRVRLSGLGNPGGFDAEVTEFLLRLQSDPKAKGSRVARSYVNEMLRNPGAKDLVLNGVRGLWQQHRLEPGPAVDLIERLMGAYAGTPALDAFALEFGRGLPASQRPVIELYLTTLTLANKRLGNTSAVVDAFIAHAKGMGIAGKLRIERYLDLLSGMNRVSAEDIARWRKFLGENN